MTKMNIENILKNRDSVMLEWVEPWPATTVAGKETHAEVFHRASVDDCINMSRHIAVKSHDVSLNDTRMQDDAFLLNEFVIVHWARAVNK